MKETDQPLHEFPKNLEKAAEKIHNAWMARNSKRENNKNLHVPYSHLPEDEKEKDRQQLYIIGELIETIPQEDVAEDEYGARLANAFGSLAHEDWRQGYDPKKTGKPRIKETPEGTTNINVPWNELHPHYKKENFEAGKTAVKVYRETMIEITQELIEKLSQAYRIPKNILSGPSDPPNDGGGGAPPSPPTPAAAVEAYEEPKEKPKRRITEFEEIRIMQ